MQIPDYYLKRPAVSHENTQDFLQLYNDICERGAMTEIKYTLSVPKWAFLCYLCDTKKILLHGSSNPAIAEFEPRQSIDVDEFGNRRAVYAASDGIWPMYFAIVNRERVTSLVNACFRVLKHDGSAPETYYYFSVDQDELPRYPWQNGMIYLLPRDTFEQQAPREAHGYDMEMSQWASPVAVTPLAKLAVTPEDFPFLNQVNGHSPKLVSERAAQNPNGFPWRD